MKKNDKAKVKTNGKSAFLLIFVSAFLAVTLIFGTVLIVISARRTARAAVSYNGATVTTGVANYFASYYKYIYMQELVRAGVERVEDYPAFWDKTAEDGKTYRVLPFKINFLKATGGGDAYSSAFLSAMLKGHPIPVCAEWGTASASLAVSADNCSDALPDEATLTAFIESRHAQGETVIFEE